MGAKLTRQFQCCVVSCVALVFSGARVVKAGQPAAEIQDAVADVGGYRLQFHVTPGASPSILFEAGGGDDSAVWADIAAKAHASTGARTITYDRAGFGKSEPASGPYSVEAEVTALERGLAALKVTDGLVLVSHSYGGFLSTLFAARNQPRVKGAVFVDANHIGFFTDEVVSGLMGSIPAAAMDQMRKARPALARVLDAMPETVKRMRVVAFPSDVPTIDVASETSPVPDPAGQAAWRRAHEQFVGASRARTLVVAAGSGHYVMRDRPDIVIESIQDIYRKTTAGTNAR
jgi:pimeloyl-ACP methyl ester carboxylesterase